MSSTSNTSSSSSSSNTNTSAGPHITTTTTTNTTNTNVIENKSKNRDSKPIRSFKLELRSMQDRLDDLSAQVGRISMIDGYDHSRSVDYNYRRRSRQSADDARQSFKANWLDEPVRQSEGRTTRSSHKSSKHKSNKSGAKIGRFENPSSSTPRSVESSSNNIASSGSRPRSSRRDRPSTIMDFPIVDSDSEEPTRSVYIARTILS